MELPRIPTADEWRSMHRKALEAAAAEAVRIIRRRTALGLDANGAPFAPYSPQYAKQRQREGLSPQVDLTVTGDLLNALQVLPSDDPDQITIGFAEEQHPVVHFATGSTRKTRRSGGGRAASMQEIAQGLLAKRNFLDITQPDELQQIASVFERELTAQMQALT